MNEKIKVLHMAPLSTGGISKLTVDINKNIDTDKIRFDYLVFRDQKEFLEDEIISLGGKKQIVDLRKEKNCFVKMIKKISAMNKLIKEENYDVVHVDASTPYDVIVAVAAKLAGTKIIIMHSHNDDYKKNIFLRDIFMNLYKMIMLFVVTDYFAISEKAASFMFPKKVYKRGKYRLVRNGINAEQIYFDEVDRKLIRTQYGIDDKLVIGHIGRFVYQKNHDFIIDFFENFYLKHPNSVLLLVGEGELQEQIISKVIDKGLEKAVIFAGVTHNIKGMLSAMDCFVFPSRFEGLGIVAIEAQSTGLLTFCADTIVDEVNISDRFIRVNSWNYEEWVEKVWEKCANDSQRRSYKNEIMKAGYDIKAVAKEMEDFYCNSVKWKE